MNQRLTELRERHRPFPSDRPAEIVLAELIIAVGGIIMGAVEDLQASVAELETNVTAENQALATVAGSLRQVSDQLAQLQAQVASGAVVSAQDLEDLAGRVKTVADAAAAATAAAQPPPPPPGPDPSPAGGGHAS